MKKILPMVLVVVFMLAFFTMSAEAFNQNHAINNDNAGSSSSSLGQKIVSVAVQLKGKPFVWGGASPESGFDCSGFTCYVLAQCGINIERTVDVQYHPEESISFKELQSGDLVFFYGPEPEHVGIYIGNGKFIHVSDTAVVETNLAGWYQSKFVGGRRFQ